MENLIITLLVGALCGWLAGLIRGGKGFGAVGNIVVGVAGGFVGPWLFKTLGVSFFVVSPLITSIIMSVIGALLVLWLIGFVQQKKR